MAIRGWAKDLPGWAKWLGLSLAGLATAAGILRATTVPLLVPYNDVLVAVAIGCLVLSAVTFIAGALSVGSTIRLRRRSQVLLEAENGPGVAQIRVENQGRRAQFTAVARVIDVRETVNNPKFLRSYQLRWQSSGAAAISLESGGIGVLVLARSNRPDYRGKYRELHELLLEGFEHGAPTVADRFRWHDGEPHGAVTLELEVTVTAKGSRPAAERFVVQSLAYGGVHIENATLPAALQSPRTD